MELAIQLVSYLVIVIYAHLDASIAAFFRGLGYPVCSPVLGRLLPLASLLLTDFGTSFVAHRLSPVKICLFLSCGLHLLEFRRTQASIICFRHLGSVSVSKSLYPLFVFSSVFFQLNLQISTFCSSLHSGRYHASPCPAIARHLLCRLTWLQLPCLQCSKTNYLSIGVRKVHLREHWMCCLPQTDMWYPAVQPIIQ